MANSIETGRNYLGSVVSRTVGINAYNRWRKYIENLPKEDATTQTLREKTIKPVGLILGFLQFTFFPTTTGSLMDAMLDHRNTGSPLSAGEFTRVTWKYISQMPIDFYATLHLPALLSHNLLEFVAWKLIANAATHVGLDAAGKGLDLTKAAAHRIRHLRSSTSTL